MTHRGEEGASDALWWAFAGLVLAWLVGLLVGITPFAHVLLVAAGGLVVVQLLRDRPFD